MTIASIDDIERLKRISSALMARVESAMDQQGNAFSLFQTAINLEGRVRRRTDELTATLRRLEQTNAQLARAKEASEVANISKTRFLAAASHDVLQPLHAAQLSISALAELQDNEKGRELVRQVERSLDTMNELLRTLLDISRLDAGVVQPDFGPVGLVSVLEDIASDFAPIAAKKSLRLTLHPRNLHVVSDKTMLRRILQNLVSNALRYTVKGGVIVGVRVRDRDAVVEVADTGCGIPPDQYDLVFDEFHRGVVAEDTSDGAHVGLGLGLSIVKRMVDALGHRLEFTSREGRGTRFRLRMRLFEGAPTSAPQTAVRAAAALPQGLPGARVLLVENDPGVLDAMIALLASWGCDVRTAHATASAVEKLSCEDWNPDIVVADQHLDHGDLGTSAIEVLRRHLGRTLPAVLVTADPAEAIYSKACELGVEVMLKPVKPAQLRALLAHLLSGSA